MTHTQKKNMIHCAGNGSRRSPRPGTVTSLLSVEQSFHTPKVMQANMEAREKSEKVDASGDEHA
jgi:hypothetical protein